MTPPREQDAHGSPQEWLAHAESDLNLARLAKGRREILPEQSCFHAQQAAEKALKAVLLFRHIEFPLVHDLEPEVRDAGSLTPYAVEARYPGHLEEVTPSDVDEAVRLAEAVLRWTSDILGGR
jgi:HEPN domain-containing protein